MYYIYRITNKVNGKTYVGQHKYKKLNDNYMGSGKLIRRAQKKYGIENFEKEILYSRIQYKETADDVERFAIAKERALGKAEYNISDGGQGGNLGEEVNKKFRWKNNPFYGKRHSEETRRKLSEMRKGVSIYANLTDEEKQKAFERKSAAMKGKNNPMYGKKYSEEERRKQSEAHKGQVAWNKGKKTGYNGTHWYNNGEINVKAKECPEGFVKGRLYIWR